VIIAKERGIPGSLPLILCLQTVLCPQTLS
jgi:hypothetical protein